MRYEDTIEIRGVTVIGQTEVALLCQMGNQQRWIAQTEFRPGSTVGREGDVGIVVLIRAASEGRRAAGRGWSSFDPTKGVRTAPQKAASAAGLLLPIEAMVAEKWSDVDLDTRTLLVRRTIDEPKGGKPARCRSVA